MIFKGCNNAVVLPDVNKELGELKGFLTEEEARFSLARFLRYNPGIAVEFLTGDKLFPFQRIMIRSMFAKDFFLAIMGRGFSKTWTASVFCFLFALFNPGCRIGLISKTFRQSRFIFENIEKFANSPQGVLLKQCFLKEPSHKNEIWKMQIGQSEIIALPLGEGGKLRGFRFNVIVIDELLLLPESIINEVILPFLSVNFDPIKRKETEERENQLIAKGIMSEEERTIFQNPKFIGLSSASYQFEYLYKLYKEYTDKIYNPDFVQSKGYGIIQFAYDVAPKHLYNEDTLQRFKASMSEQQFQREFGAVFTDDSGGYFSKKKMDDCTVKEGNEPTIEIVGDKDAKYILSIDPSWSQSEASDHFAMSVLKLDEAKKSGTIVHNYAVAGGKTQDHMKYLRYILQHFNVVFVIIDKAGSWFIDNANVSTIFSEAKLKINFVDGDFFDENYIAALNLIKRSYNVADNRIGYQQYFSAPWIRRANEILSSAFDHRTIFFAAPALGDKFQKLLKSKIPINELNYNNGENLEGDAKLADFIEHQVYLIDLVKNETALIQLSADGDSTTHKFRLPSNLRNSDSPDKARRDNYTTLLMGNWAMQQYYNMMYSAPSEQKSFVPFFIG